MTLKKDICIVTNSPLAKKLKKNNVAVDIINFGEEDVNEAKLDAFIKAVESGGNRYIYSFPL